MQSPPDNGGCILVQVKIRQTRGIVQLRFIVLWDEEAVDTGFESLVIAGNQHADFFIPISPAPGQTAHQVRSRLMIGEKEVRLSEVITRGGIGRTIKLVGRFLLYYPVVKRQVRLTNKRITIPRY